MKHIFAFFFLFFHMALIGQGTGCANAVALTINGSCASGTISDATADAPALSSCPTGTFSREGWYKFTVTAGPQNITVTGTTGNRNLFLQVISEITSCTGLTQIACANATTTNSSQTETINLTNLINGTYYIKVVNVGTAGNMTLNSLCVTSPPANDVCSGSVLASCGNTYTGTTTYASTTGDPTANCTNGTGGSPGAPGVWYTFIGAGQIVTASLCGSSYDTKLHVYSGSCAGLTCVDSNDDDCGLQSTVTFAAASATTYYILVNGFGTSSVGTYSLNISCCIPATPPCASGLLPSNGATGVNRCSALSWTAPSTSGCNTISSYSVFAGTNPSPPFSGTTTATSYTLPAFSASTTYYWRIVPVNGAGGALGCTTQSFSTNSLPGCPGPGGVATGLAFWVKANAISSSPSDNTTIATWDDKSGAVRNATQATAANSPVYKDNANDNINYNPIVSLDGTDDYMDISSNGVLPKDNNDYAVYAVLAPITNTTTPGKFFFAGDIGSADNFCSFDVRASGGINDSWNNNDLIVTSQWLSFESLICTFNYGSSQRTIYKNGLLIGTLNTFTSRMSADVNSTIGKVQVFNNEFYGGKIAEIISFKDLSHAVNSRERIESYLAIKYGKTLPHHYYSAPITGVTIFNVSAPYNTNIIGIGRDDTQSLIQKQSRTDDDSVRIYKGILAATNNTNSATFISDESYVVMGANTGKLCNTAASRAEMPASCGLYSRLEREWKVTNTNFAETFSIDVKLNSCAVPGSVTIAHLRLLVDDDGNFASGVTNCYANGASGITISYANPVITISGISNAIIGSGTTKYITIASTNSLTPLPVELISFTANCDNNHTLLQWTTATETNCKQYEVQRSDDGINYTTIAAIAGHGTSLQQNNYRYTDNAEVSREYYYRLKQVDLNNTFTYYNTIVSVNDDCGTAEQDISLYPSPANESVMIQSRSKKTLSVEIINDCGQMVYSGTITGEAVQVRTAHLANGIYTVRVVSHDKSFVKKLAITH